MHVDGNTDRNMQHIIYMKRMLSVARLCMENIRAKTTRLRYKAHLNNVRIFSVNHALNNGV